MAIPEQFGQPCWEKDQAEKCINIVAQVDREQASLFLATHSPIKKIKDAKADKQINEEDAFRSLFSQKGEIRAIVRGASGTGKSHLIRWINLRAEYAVDGDEFGLAQFKIVMVKRETGSLKSALKQIVDQLGKEFAQFITDINTSVDRFSSQTGREALIQELALEINQKWVERGKDPIPKRLEVVGDVLLSPGYRKWLGRDDSIVAKKIDRLTENSTPEEREKTIVFGVDDLIPDAGYLNASNDARKVHEFIEDLEYEPETCEATVELLNSALIDAQRELTGIKGAKLHEIFTNIRRELKTQGKQLAVFIEDVTAASGGLDLDMFQAFEPQKDKDLCRMIALLGMTNEGWEVLPRNEQDRVDFQFDVGENAVQWANDPKEVSKFTARYLNALRCKDEEIKILARERFTSDIPSSKCNVCGHIQICHKTFGFAEFEDGVRVGLFPFSETTPHKLLISLNEERHRTSPRGLLDMVMNVALVQSYEHFIQHSFPESRNFGVQRPALVFWTEFQSRFLGGSNWASASNRDRVRFLAEFWIDADSSDRVAQFLEPFRNPLSFPEFSSAPPLQPPKVPNVDPLTPSPSPPEDGRLKDFLAKVDEWSRGNQLTSDAKFRELLSKMIDKAVRWQDHRGVPIEFARGPGITRGYAYVRIEDQISKVSSQRYFLDFPRNEDTRRLLEAQVRYQFEGNESWNFSRGEYHKRQVFRWLRKNEKQIVESITPTPRKLTNDAVKAASQILALAAILRTRSRLPIKEPQKRIAEIFSPIWDEETRPRTVTDSLKKFVIDIEKKWKSVKDFLISELGVGQGAAPPKNFIDPMPILEALNAFEEELIVEIPPEEIDESFWKKRFGAVSKLGAYDELPNKLDEERLQIEKKIDSLKSFLNDSGFSGKDLKAELIACVKEIVEVIEIQRKNLNYYDRDFDKIWDSGNLQGNRNHWGLSLSRAAKVVASTKYIDSLCFDPTSLEEAYSDLTVGTLAHLNKIETELHLQENPTRGGNGGSKDELLNELKKLSGLLEKG